MAYEPGLWRWNPQTEKITSKIPSSLGNSHHFILAHPFKTLASRIHWNLLEILMAELSMDILNPTLRRWKGEGPGQSTLWIPVVLLCIPGWEPLVSSRLASLSYVGYMDSFFLKCSLWSPGWPWAPSVAELDFSWYFFFCFHPTPIIRQDWLLL